MGKHRFKFSDMMPNAWFYKLRDMGKIRNQKLSHPIKKPASSTPKTKAGAATIQREGEFSLPRNSYYYTTGERFCASPVNLKASDTHFPDSPRRSKKVRNNNGNHRSSKLVSSSVSAGCSCRATVESVWDPDEDDLDSSPESISDHNLREVLCSSELCEPIYSDSVRSKSGKLFDKGSIGWSSSCSCRVSTSSTDIILDMEKKPFRKFDVFESPQLSPELELPPILARPAKFNDLILNIKKKKVSEPICRKSSANMEVNVGTRVGDGDRISHGSVSVKDLKKGITTSFREQRSTLRKSSVENTTSSKASLPISQGMKMKIRANSPRLASKKIQALNRKTMTMNSKSRKKSVSESYAVMKSSYDPQRDFRDSMVEMIMEHNIRSSNDLEDLLACYLSLNSNEYHDVIIKVFEQVWFDLPDIRLLGVSMVYLLLFCSVYGCH